MTESYRHLPADIPVPIDDGAADHLRGMEVPSVTLSSTLGEAARPGRGHRAPGRGVRLPAHGGAGRAAAGGMGRDPGRPRLHAAELRLPRPRARARGLRRLGARPERPAARGAAGVCRPRAHPLPAAERSRSAAGARAWAAHLRGRRPELLPASDPDRRINGASQRSSTPSSLRTATPPRCSTGWRISRFRGIQRPCPRAP